MNHALWNLVAARVVAIAFVTTGLAACGEKLSNVSSGGPSASPVSPSAQVIGTTPAPPQPEPAGVVAVAPDTKELTKKQEVNDMPKEGQDSSHLTEAQGDSQRTGGGDQQTERRAQ